MILDNLAIDLLYSCVKDCPETKHPCPEELNMKEITEADLNMALLKKRTKAQLIQMVCHIGNTANDYTQTGPLMGDRVLSKLNLTKDKFQIRYK